MQYAVLQLHLLISSGFCNGIFSLNVSIHLQYIKFALIHYRFFSLLQITSNFPLRLAHGFMATIFLVSKICFTPNKTFNLETIHGLYSLKSQNELPMSEQNLKSNCAQILYNNALFLSLLEKS